MDPISDVTYYCKGGTCDDSARCGSAGRCTYRSSAEVAREAQKNEAAREHQPSPECLLKKCPTCLPKFTGVEQSRVVGITQEVRKFDTGATRSPDTDRPDYEAFLSPLVLERYAEYMHRHRLQADGSLREGDNWQKGIPLKSYMKSAWRHFITWWKGHRGLEPFSEEDLCALLFNAMGYLHEKLKAKRASP